MTIQAIDRNACKLIRSNLELALTQALKDMGVICDIGTIKFSDRRATCSLTFALADSTAPGKSAKVIQAEVDWEGYHTLFSLKKEWLHQTFVSNGKTFRIAGLMPSRPKNALLADELHPLTNEPTGKRFVFPPKNIVDKMRVAEATKAAISNAASNAIKKR